MLRKVQVPVGFDFFLLKSQAYLTATVQHNLSAATCFLPMLDQIIWDLLDNQ